MTPSIRTVIYPVNDLARAKAVFGAILGTPPVMDEPYYVQFDADGQEIGLDPNGASKGIPALWPTGMSVTSARQSSSYSRSARRSVRQCTTSEAVG
jgi:hypothetical protein